MPSRDSVTYGRNASLYRSCRVARNDSKFRGLRNGIVEFVREIAKRLFIFCQMRNTDAQLLRSEGVGI